MTRFSEGVWAEAHAKQFFVKQGFRCLKERYRTPWGEIDLIIEHKNLLVFAEVKKRPSLKEGLEALSPRQCKRILQAGSFFLHQYPPLFWNEIRIDLVVVWGQGYISHHPNILQWTSSENTYL